MLMFGINKCITLLLIIFIIIFSSCSVQQQIAKSAKVFISDSSLANAHTGISIYDPFADKYWYNYQGDKYFIPASNIKIVTCYAAMKWLGDSLASVSYSENDTAVFINPAGDPTILHPGFKKQPVVEFLQKVKKKIYISDKNWESKTFGAGWSWDDYNDSYMPERSALPLYGNVIKWIQTQTLEKPDGVHEQYVPSVFSEPEVNWDVNFNTDSKDSLFFVQRSIAVNSYIITEGKEKYKEQNVPFVTNGLQSALGLLKDTVGKEISITLKPFFQTTPIIIHSQSTDSLLKPMMHNSDNFFAEQSLLMVSK
jgi:serine-type D-Ala-D-Ala carboxypeptidase/endopeptidase (penicillin-binding protein 4)